jgi:hypothetical protein
MRILSLAAGFAAGYVLGSRAGREKYEQIAATAHRMSNHPSVAQAQATAKNLLNGGTDAVAVTQSTAASHEPPAAAGDSSRPARRKATSSTATRGRAGEASL